MPSGSSFKRGRHWVRAKFANIGHVLKPKSSKKASHISSNPSVSLAPITDERASGAAETALFIPDGTLNTLHIPANYQEPAPPDPGVSECSTDNGPSSSQDFEAGKAVEELTSPMWAKAMKDFHDQKPLMFALLKDQIAPIKDLEVRKWDTWSNLRPEGTSVNPHHAWIERFQARLPSLASIKSLAVRLGTLDPHSLAPYIVTGAFVAVELCLGIIDPKLRDGAMAVILKTSLIINKWNQCEDDSAQMRKIPDREIVRKIDEIEQMLPELYEQGLDLISSVYDSGKGKGRQAMATITSIQTKWKDQSNQLEFSNDACTNKRSHVDRLLKIKKENVAVLNWIKHSDDPETDHETMSLKKGLNNDRLKDDIEAEPGKWFLETPQFNNWVGAIAQEDAAKRVCWLKGAMGTGKTTLMCRVISYLRILPLVRARLVHYYCDASNTEKQTPTGPDYAIIIRALCCRLAWKNNGRLAEPASTLYVKLNPEVSTPDRKPTIDDWEKLLRDLISAQPGPTVFVIDALDECRRPEDYKKLLGCLSKIQTLFPSTYFLFSSRQHIPVADYFEIYREEVDAVSPEAVENMKAFITSQISSDQREPLLKKSIFFSDEYLRSRLEEALFRNANGMYRWVEIWLGVFFPMNGKPIRQLEEAEKRIKSLEEFQSLNQLKDKQEEKAMRRAYENLWDINGDQQYHSYQTRAFRLILASLEPLTPQQLHEAVLFDPDEPDHHSENFEFEELEGLYHNFLTTNRSGYLEFEHVSARAFVSELNEPDCDEPTFSTRLNFRFMADVAIKALERPAHPIWKHCDVDLVDWSRRLREIKLFDSKSTRRMGVKDIFTGLDPLKARRFRDHFAFYLLRHWIEHCQSIFLDEDFHQRIIGLSRNGTSGLEGYILLACSRSLLGAYGPRWAEEYRWFGESKDVWAHRTLTQSPSGARACSHPFLHMVSFGISPCSPSIPSGDPQDALHLRDGFQMEDLTVRNLYGQTALHIASFMGSDKIIRDLLRLEPSLLNMEDYQKRTALCFASTEAVVKSLLEMEALHAKLKFPPVIDGCESKILNWNIYGSAPAIIFLIQRFEDDFLLWLLQRYEIKCLSAPDQRSISLDVDTHHLQLGNYERTLPFISRSWWFRNDKRTVSLISTALCGQKLKTFSFLLRALGQVEYKDHELKITSDGDIDTLLQIIKADKVRTQGNNQSYESSLRQRSWHEAGMTPWSFIDDEEFSTFRTDEVSSSRLRERHQMTDIVEE